MANKPKNIAYPDKFASKKTQVQRRERNDLVDILDVWITHYLQLVVGLRSMVVNRNIAFNLFLAKIIKWYFTGYHYPIRYMPSLCPNNPSHSFAFQLAKATEMDNFEPGRRPDHHSQHYTQHYSNLLRSSPHHM